MNPLLILGGAACVWEDLSSALNLAHGPMDIAAVNDVGYAYTGDIVFWVTLHPEKFEAWQLRRAQNGGTGNYQAFSHKRYTQARIDTLIAERWPGSSGLYAVQVAREHYGYQKIICCGIPMDASPHFFDEKAWEVCRGYRKGWLRAQAIQDCTRSMSGWTKALLGSPTLNWLYSE